MTDLFLITSVINTGNQPWSYKAIRSCFTKEERYQQTLMTIESIRKYHGDARIMLVECSEMDEDMTNTLTNKVDYFIQTYDDNEVRYSCLESNKKGYGEVMKIKKACEVIQTQGITFDTLFKISGRYYLNTSFDKNKYKTSHYVFRMFPNNTGITTLYSVPHELFDVYQNNINICADFYKTSPPTSLEALLPSLCEPKIDIPLLGVCGNLGVYDDEGKSEYYQA